MHRSSLYLLILLFYTMPRLSRRQLFLNKLWAAAQQSVLTNNLLLPVDDDSDAGSNTSLERDHWGLVPVSLWLVYVAAAASHYCFCPQIYHMCDFHSAMPMWQQIVEGYKYNEEEFLQHFCCPRRMFQLLVGLLRDHPSISYDPVATWRLSIQQ